MSCAGDMYLSYWEEIDMRKTRIGLMVVASHFESGGERADDLTKATKDMLLNAGYEVLAASKTVWDPADAMEQGALISKGEPDLVLVIHASWVLDSLQFALQTAMDCPMVMWAVPYINTFSLACVQHFGSVLKQRGMSCRYLYGLPGDKALQNRLAVYAAAARAHHAVKKARVALIGPRQTWRVAGPQDSTIEEWDFSEKFGASIIHIEMEELIGAAEAQSESAALEALNTIRKDRLGKCLADDECLLWYAKVYLGIKQLASQYGLSAVAAECYPNYIGLTNVPASWLADEGFVVETEGDIGHATMMLALNEMAPGITALAEAGGYDVASNGLYLAHGGSSAHSLAGDASTAYIPKTGKFVGLKYKPTPVVTLASIRGGNGAYRLSVTTGSIEEANQAEWEDAGYRLVAKFRPRISVEDFFDGLLDAGTDHHVLIHEGDLTRQLAVFCDLFGVEKVDL